MDQNNKYKRINKKEWEKWEVEEEKMDENDDDYYYYYDHHQQQQNKDGVVYTHTYRVI